VLPVWAVWPTVPVDGTMDLIARYSYILTHTEGETRWQRCWKTLWEDIYFGFSLLEYLKGHLEDFQRLCTYFQDFAATSQALQQLCPYRYEYQYKVCWEMGFQTELSHVKPDSSIYKLDITNRHTYNHRKCRSKFVMRHTWPCPGITLQSAEKGLQRLWQCCKYHEVIGDMLDLAKKIQINILDMVIKYNKKEKQT